MTKKYAFLVTLFLLSLAVMAQRPVPFKKFGYPEETVIRGIQGKTSLYVPISRGVVIEKSSAHLVFVASQVLNLDRSYLTVFVNGIPLKSAYLKSSDDTLRIDIPLEERFVSSGFIRFDLRTQLRISDEVCEDYSDAGYWVRMTRQSFMNFTVDFDKEEVRDREIEAVVQKVEQIVIPDNPTEMEIKHASYVHFFLAPTMDARLRVLYEREVPENQLDKSLLIGVLDHFRSSVRQNVVMPPDTTEGLITVYNPPLKNMVTGEDIPTENLLITAESEQGLEKAIHYFIQPDFLRSSYTPSVIVSNDLKPINYRAVNKYAPIYFENIGVGYELLEGIGSIESEITFRRSDFGALVDRLELHLEGVYRPMDATENAFLNIYLNDVLLTSSRLDETGTLDFTFSNENFVLRKLNLLKIQFFYVPDDGFCQGKSVNFFAQLDPVKCYLKPVDYVNKPPLSFFWFPENFNDHPTRIYVQTQSGIGTVAAVSDVINMINPGDEREGYVYPEVEVFEDVRDLETDSAYNKVIFAHQVDRLAETFDDDIQVDFLSDTVSYEVRKLNQLLSVRYGDEMGWNQLFEHEDEAVMLLYNPMNDTLTLQSLIRSIREQAMTNTGNLIIAKNKESYFFNLSDNTREETELQTKSIFLTFWGTYGIFVVIALLILAMLMLVYLYQKSQQSKRSIEENEG